MIKILEVKCLNKIANIKDPLSFEIKYEAQPEFIGKRFNLRMLVFGNDKNGYFDQVIGHTHIQPLKDGKHTMKYDCKAIKTKCLKKRNLLSFVEVNMEFSYSFQEFQRFCFFMNHFKNNKREIEVKEPVVDHFEQQLEGVQRLLEVFRQDIKDANKQMEYVEEMMDVLDQVSEDNEQGKEIGERSKDNFAQFREIIRQGTTDISEAMKADELQKEGVAQEIEVVDEPMADDTQSMEVDEQHMECVAQEIEVVDQSMADGAQMTQVVANLMEIINQQITGFDQKKEGVGKQMESVTQNTEATVQPMVDVEQQLKAIDQKLQAVEQQQAGKAKMMENVNHKIEIINQQTKTVDQQQMVDGMQLMKNVDQMKAKNPIDHCMNDINKNMEAVNQQIEGLDQQIEGIQQLKKVRELQMKISAQQLEAEKQIEHQRQAKYKKLMAIKKQLEEKKLMFTKRQIEKKRKLMELEAMSRELFLSPMGKRHFEIDWCVKFNEDIIVNTSEPFEIDIGEIIVLYDTLKKHKRTLPAVNDLRDDCEVFKVLPNEGKNFEYIKLTHGSSYPKIIRIYLPETKKHFRRSHIPQDIKYELKPVTSKRKNLQKLQSLTFSNHKARYSREPARIIPYAFKKLIEKISKKKRAKNLHKQQKKAESKSKCKHGKVSRSKSKKESKSHSETALKSASQSKCRHNPKSNSQKSSKNTSQNKAMEYVTGQMMRTSLILEPSEFTELPIPHDLEALKQSKTFPWVPVQKLKVEKCSKCKKRLQEKQQKERKKEKNQESAESFNERLATTKTIAREDLESTIKQIMNSSSNDPATTPPIKIRRCMSPKSRSTALLNQIRQSVPYAATVSSKVEKKLNNCIEQMLPYKSTTSVTSEVSQASVPQEVTTEVVTDMTELLSAEVIPEVIPIRPLQPSTNVQVLKLIPRPTPVATTISKPTSTISTVTNLAVPTLPTTLQSPSMLSRAISSSPRAPFLPTIRVLTQEQANELRKKQP